MIAGFAAAVVLLPLFVLIERRGRAPMLDLTIFRDRLFAAAAARGVHQRPLALRADVPVRLLLPGRRRATTRSRPGIKLAPMALGDARRLAARRRIGRPARLAHARRARACSITAVALAGMTTLRGRDARTGRAALWLALVGDRLGHVQLPEHGRDDGYRAADTAAASPPGARTMLQNTGAVISIAFVLAIVTAAVPKDVAVQDLLRRSPSGLSAAAARRRSSRTCTRRCGCSRRSSLLGAVVSLLRPEPHARRQRRDAQRPPSARYASARSPSCRARRRARSATTRRSACCPRPRTAKRARTASTREADVERLQRADPRCATCSGSRSTSSSALVEAEEARAGIARGAGRPTRRPRRADADPRRRRSATCRAPARARPERGATRLDRARGRADRHAGSGSARRELEGDRGS